MKMDLETRKSRSKSEVIRNLLEIMIKKKTNLCLAADVTKFQNLVDLAEKVGEKICCLKTHVDILVDWKGQESIEILKNLAKKHNFLLFEDRKLADIGKTVEGQFHDGLYSISSWANLVTVHGLPGKIVKN